MSRDFRLHPVGVTSCCLVVSQLLTLYITPVVYIYFEQFRQWVSSRRRAARPEPASAAAD